MPFKSEAQRRYLWANEPEIARDWTDTYGSRIQKNNGGIMRLGFDNGGTGVNYADDDIMVKVELLREQYPDKYHEDMVTDEEMVEMVKANEDGSFIDKGFNRVNDLYSGITQWGGPLWNAYRGNIGGAALGSIFGPLGIMGGAYAGNKLGSLRGYNEGQGRYNTQAEYEANRAARQLSNRRTNILNRAAAEKKVGNVNELLGKYGYKGGALGSGDISFTGKPQGEATAGAGYSRSDDSWGASPFRGGGLASLWPR